MTPKDLRKRLSDQLAALPRSREDGESVTRLLEDLGFYEDKFVERLLEGWDAPQPLTEPSLPLDLLRLRRWVFLVEARSLYPEVLEDLKADAFRHPVGEDRHCALLEWAERFCLAETWIHGAAWQTLKCWGEWEHETGSVPHRWHFELEFVEKWRQRGDERIAWLKEAYFYELPKLSWSPHDERGEAAIERSRKKLQRAAEDFAILVRGHEAYSAYRQVRKEEEGALHHYRWLIVKQVEGRTYAEIAEDSGANKDSVRRAVRDLAAALGVTRRDDRRGRPPGRKDTRPRTSPTRW